MPDQARARIWRLWAWFALNLVIFIACYLNYRLQLKHRYLFRTLGVGLCLSRAAAMVINFNLLLVWLPMCKYTLTRLAVLASHSCSRHKTRLNQLKPVAPTSTSNKPPEHSLETILERPRHPGDHSDQPNSSSLLVSRLARKFKQSLGAAARRVRYALCSLKIKFMGNFLIAVDHCTSLHTICATTITIASVIHTVAHLMNVINFSNKFDPLLGDLNMAEYRGQNPLQLIVSVPGVTGCCMVLILFLMSLSSISTIRNSSHDLFQVFHRLSILFVVLLILHPSSHVLKEQNNVSRHHPELCYERMQQLLNQETNVRAATNDSLRVENPVKMAEQLQPARFGLRVVKRNEWTNESTTLPSSMSGTQESHGDDSNTEAFHNGTIESKDLKRRVKRDIQDQNKLSDSVEKMELNEPLVPNDYCIDLEPSFVAQSSICWYVVGAGLSCYILDLLLRRLRRSRSPIELLNARTDAEGNLIELVLGNNHKRFLHWLPGQFVYLNCPQIATYEWHPFTISSMDNDTRQFTLHIKTGGDWTRKLRYELELRQNCQKLQRQPSEGYAGHKEKSMSLSCQRQGAAFTSHCHRPDGLKTIPGIAPMSDFQKNSHPNQHSFYKPDYSKIVNVVANMEEFDHTTGQLKVACKRLVHLAHQDNVQTAIDGEERHNGAMKNANACMKIDLNYVRLGQQICTISQYDKATALASSLVNCTGTSSPALDLFIDGPFHSPFERLLEQQVSVCIASGVGWTAFSSIFQKITDKIVRSDVADKYWWWQWRNFRPPRHNLTGRNCEDSIVFKQGSSVTKLHLVAIVTTIEQFKPFYYIVKRYFDTHSMRIGISGTSDETFRDPVQEVTAFITRSARHDLDVVEFCRKENLILPNEQNCSANLELDSLRINEAFLVRFGKPDFDSYISSFSNLYASKRKISVYCCGPHQVKRAVKDICRNLNKRRKTNPILPNIHYHEENF